MSAQRHLCCAFGIIWASLDGFSQNQRNLHGVGIGHGKSIAQSPRQPRMTRESAILIHAFKPERHSGRMVRTHNPDFRNLVDPTQPLSRPCGRNPYSFSPDLAQLAHHSPHEDRSKHRSAGTADLHRCRSWPPCSSRRTSGCFSRSGAGFRSTVHSRRDKFLL